MAGIFQPSDSAGNLARSFYVHVEQDLRKYLVWVQAPRVLPCWRSRNGCSLPTSVCLSVCLSVPGSCVQCSGPCSPLAVHRWWEGRAASTSQHGVDVQRCHGALAGARHIPGTVAGKGSLWLRSRLSQRGDVGGGGCLPAPGGLLLLCGNEVMSAPGGNRAGARAAGGSAQGCLPCPSPAPGEGLDMPVVCSEMWAAQRALTHCAPFLPRDHRDDSKRQHCLYVWCHGDEALACWQGPQPRQRAGAGQCPGEVLCLLLLPREMGSNLGVPTVPWVRSVWYPVLYWESWALAGACPHEDVPLLPRHCLTVPAVPNSVCLAADCRWEGSPGRCGSGRLGAVH